MLPLVAVVLLLLYLPARLSRGFPAMSRVGIWLIVTFKTVLVIAVHAQIVSTTGHPIIADDAIDARAYYDVGEAFVDYSPWDISRAEVRSVRGASSHLGYYYLNILAFQVCPEYPMLFLRLLKLLIFHVALGMLATSWRLSTSATRSFWAYVVLGVLFYQLFYYVFRNTKDDIILSLFMMIMAIADRTLGIASPDRRASSQAKTLAAWIAIGVLIWMLSELRFYLGFAIVCAFGLHLVTGRGMKLLYRLLLGGVIAGGFVLLMGTSGFGLVEERGGASALTGALLNPYGLFKLFVTPLPWQHASPMLSIPHTLYLFMLAPALWAFAVRFRSNLDWKLYVVMAVAVVVGGHMNNFNPRKRYVMYPVFIGWMVTAKRREESRKSESEASEFDLDAYFANPRQVYTSP